MQLGLLGPLVLADGAGRQVQVAGTRLRVLLAVLALQANTPVSTDVLAEAVWDGVPSPGAVRTLRSHIARLRRLLGPDAGRVESREPGYLIRVDPGELDVARFEALCREAGAAVRAGEWARTADTAARALELWRGTPLADVPSQLLRDRWVPHLEQLHVQALEWRIEGELHEGRHEQVIGELGELIARHPLREHFHGQLMLALYRCGRQGEALAAYRASRDVLIAELGVEPGPGLQDLHRKILSADPALATAGPARHAEAAAGPGVPRELAVPGSPGQPAELEVLAGLADRPGEQDLCGFGPSGTPATPAEAVRGSPVPGAGGIVSRPRLFGRLGAARVTVVSAPPGSGKTVLLRSWASRAGAAGGVARVTVRRGERDPVQFWLSVLGSLRQTASGQVLVQPLTAAPGLDGWAITERLLADLAPLRDRTYLVIDDVQELGPDEARRQLELLVMRAPQELRFVLATRHDVRLGLHRLRLEGELAEIRGPDLRFTVAEAGELLDAAGVTVPDPALLVARTEGWAAGLRLAALSLAGHPDPGRFSAEFSGTERTVAEYLLAEVLDRQPGPVRRLLMRTSVLERVNGELAGLLAGDSGGERVLQDLEQANAFVVSLDARRSWFRYHHLFADLLQLELRRTEPDEVTALHRVACGWFAGHGYLVEAVRHAQAARDWGLAARLLADGWYGLQLDGQAATAHELLAGFPAGVRREDAELAALAAAEELAHGALEAAERYLGLAERGLASVPDARRAHARLLLGITRLVLARQRWSLQAVAEETQRLQRTDEALDAAEPGLGEELRALALISLGSTEFWAAGQDPERHLEMGVALARRIGRPFLELTGLAYQAAAGLYRSFTRAAERGRLAIELAERHGWANEPAAGLTCVILAAILAWQMRPGEAEPWVQRAERVLRAETEPAAVLGMHRARAVLELARGRDADALAALQAAERLGGRLTAPHMLLTPTRALRLHTVVRLGEIERAEQALADLGEHDRDQGETRIAAAVLRLAQDDPRAAMAALAPVLDGSAPLVWPTGLAEAFLLEAIARDALGDEDSAGRALERALDLAEPDGALLWFFLHPAPDLLQRHARHRTAHPALIADILSLLAGSKPAPPAGPPPPLEPLSASEIRVLRYLPTHLPAPQIASELHLSHNTVRTHMRHLYAKLGAHRRSEAVERARALGLLAPSPVRGPVTPPR